MLFAELIPQEAKDIGNMSVAGLLGVGLFVFAGVVIYLFRRGEKKDAETKADQKESQEKHEKRLDEMQERHEASIKEQRAEHTAAMGKIADAVKVVADESRAHAQECRANFALLTAEMKQLKGQD